MLCLWTKYEPRKGPAESVLPAVHRAVNGEHFGIVNRLLDRHLRKLIGGAEQLWSMRAMVLFIVRDHQFFFRGYGQTALTSHQVLI